MIEPIFNLFPNTALSPLEVLCGTSKLNAGKIADNLVISCNLALSRNEYSNLQRTLISLIVNNHVLFTKPFAQYT